MYTRLIYFISFCLVFSEISCDATVAVAHFLNSVNVTGTVLFTKTEAGVHVTGTITGLDAGLYGFHVHELGDIIDCDATGAHFNPEITVHGGRDHDVRHVGDLGNVEFVGNPGVATLDFVDNVITLQGVNSIVGRGLVLHEGEDDLGLTDHPASQTTGNAGGRVACGVIGIKEWSEDESNSASVFSPTSLLLLITSVYIFSK